MNYNNYKVSKRDPLAEFKAKQQYMKQQNERMKNASFFEKVGDTLLDVGGSVVGGVSKGLEGIVDAGAGVVGLLGFGNKKFKDNVQKFIANDWTANNITNPLLQITDTSYINKMGEKGQRITRGVLSGVGQMLPAVGVGLLTGGAGFMPTVMVSAGGSGMEEASKEGASYGKAFAYGVGTGVLEGAIEKLTGNIGKAFIGKTATGSLTKNIARRITGNKFAQKGLLLAMDAAGEGGEEMVSEMISPFLKRATYDPSAQFATAEEVFEAGVIGAFTSLAYQGSVGQVGAKGMNANSAMSEIKEIDNKIDSNWALNNIENNAKLLQQRQFAESDLNDIIGGIKPEKLSKFVDKNGLERYVSEGKANLHPLANMSSDGVLSAQNDISYSPSLDVAKAKYAPTTQKLSTEQVQARQDFGKLNSVKSNAKLVFTDSLPEGQHGAYSNGVIYVSTKANAPTEVVKHEFTHSLEGTKEYAKLSKYVIESFVNDAELSKKFATYKNSSGIEFDINATEKLYQDYLQGKSENEKSQDVVKEMVAMYVSETMFTDKAQIERLARKDKGLFNRAFNYIKDRVAFVRGKKNKTASDVKALQFLLRAEKLYRKAIGGADETVSSRSKNKTSLSIKKTPDGKEYVNIDTNQDVFDGIEVKDYPKVAKMYIQDYFQGKEFPLSTDGGTALIISETARKFAYSGNEMNKQIHDAKMKVSTELDNLLKISELINKKEDTKNHKFATKGFEYYKSNFMLDGVMFSGILNVGVSKNGKTIYEVNKIKRESPYIKLSDEKSPFESVRTSSNTSILQNNEKVNSLSKENESKSKNGIVTIDKDIKYSLNKTFSEQIDDVIAGVHNSNYDIFVGNTPDVLINLGFEDKPLLMRNSKIIEVFNKHSEISIDILKQVPSALESPVVILKSKTNPNESVVVVTDILTAKGSIIVPVWINQQGMYFDVDMNSTVSKNTNFIASVYGRNVKSLLDYAIQNNGVLYIDTNKKRAENLFGSHGLQLPTLPISFNSNNSILQDSKNVNSLAKENENKSKNGIVTIDKDIKYSLNKTFSEQIDDVIAGTHAPELDLYVSETPDVLCNIGFEQKPLLMRNGKINEILLKHDDITENILKQLPDMVKNPILILKSKTEPEQSVVVITNTVTPKGNVIVPVWVKQDGTYYNVELDKNVFEKTNFVASVYGRNVKNLLDHANNNNGYIYVSDNKKEVNNLFNTHGLQLPTPLKGTNFNNSILQNNKNVNSLNSENKNKSKNGIVTIDKNVKYSLNKTFSEQIDDIASGSQGDMDNTHVLVMEHTPEIYRTHANMADIPMLMSFRKVCISMFSEGSLSDHYHSLGAEAMKELPKALKNPLYILKPNDASNDRVEVIVDMQDKKGRDVFAVIELDSNGRVDNKFIDANILITVFGAKSKYIEKRLDNATILYENKKRLYAQVNPQGQFPHVFNASNLNNSILQNNKNVNSLSNENENENKSSNKEVLDEVLAEEVQKEVEELKELSKAEKEAIKLNAQIKSDKVHNRVDAERVIDEILDEYLVSEYYQSRITNKEKNKVIDKLFEVLNATKQIHRESVVNDIVDALVDKVRMESIFKADEIAEYKNIIAELGQYKRMFSLESIRGEIEHKFDKKIKNVFLSWNGKGKTNIDGIFDHAEELRAVGIEIKGKTPADAFLKFMKLLRKLSM